MEARRRSPAPTPVVSVTHDDSPRVRAARASARWANNTTSASTMVPAGRTAAPLDPASTSATRCDHFRSASMELSAACIQATCFGWMQSLAGAAPHGFRSTWWSPRAARSRGRECQLAEHRAIGSREGCHRPRRAGSGPAAQAAALMDDLLGQRHAGASQWRVAADAARAAGLPPTDPVSIDERLHGLVPGSCYVDWRRN